MFRIPSRFGKAGPIFRRYEFAWQFATGQPLLPVRPEGRTLRRL